MHGDREAEAAGSGGDDFAPVCAAIGRTKDAAMMLGPQHVGTRRALHNAMGILDQRIQLAPFRHEVGAHTLPHMPCGTAVARAPGAAARDTDDNIVGVVGMNADRMNARHVVAAAKPLLALRHLPETLDESPRAAAIIGAKQAAGDGARPHALRSAPMIPFEHPDLFERPRVRIFDTLRLCRIDGRRPFVPRRAAIGRCAQLDAEMTELQRRQSAHPGRVAHHRGHRLAGEMVGGDPPGLRAGAAALEDEQALARGYGKLHCDPFSAGTSAHSVDF